MKGKELIEWIRENKLEDGDVYVDEAEGYAPVEGAWESEKDGGAVILIRGDAD